MSEPVDWQGITPRSPRFDDIYFSPENGLAESQAVFLAGCGLPDAWSGRERFVVGELGFGVGLNVLALAELWGRTRPSATATLHVFSIEAFPIDRDDAAAALARWPALSALAAPLIAAWPRGRRGKHRIEWPSLGVILDLAIGEVLPALAQWSGDADAWFLDGFAPARNPEMWSDAVMALVAVRSRPGARAATFTVAGGVRRALQAAGFGVQKQPGFGAKRERLEARLASSIAAPEAPCPRVAIIGAGIAGAALSRAFRRLGLDPVVLDAEGAGAGASGNLAALVTPRLDAGFGPVAALHAAAFARATGLYRSETPEAILAEGVVQLEADPRDADRFDRVAGWDGFDPGALVRLDAKAAAARLGEPPNRSGLFFPDALVIEPAPALAHWLGAPLRRQTVRLLLLDNSGWRLWAEKDDDDALGVFDIVCLAAGAACRDLVPDLDLRPVRGQVSASDLPFDGAPGTWEGYAIPTRDGCLFGATHDRDDAGLDLRAEDDLRNLSLLAQGRPGLASRIRADGMTLTARAGLRAATRDHRPLAGAAPDRPGLFMLTGLGGRGFTLAPLLAEAVAATVLGLPSPLPRDLQALVSPARQVFGKAAANGKRPSAIKRP